MKKFLKILGTLSSLALVLILTIPFFVQVDHYRPEIVKAVNSRLNGKFELGHLELSLWGRVHIQADGVRIEDASGSPVLSVKDVAFDMPFTAILSGAPLITLVMKEPEARVVKGKDGKLNVMTLVKMMPAGSSGASSAGTGSPPSAGAEGAMKLPGIVQNAHFGMKVESARVVYLDQALQLSNTVDRLNLRVKDFSLSRKTEMEVWAELKTKMGADLSVMGPLQFNLTLTPELSGGEFKKASVLAVLSADDLLIEKGSLFVKKKGVPTRMTLKAELSSSELGMKEATLEFHNLKAVLSGRYNTETGADVKFQAKDVDLGPWSDLIPLAKEYELAGKLSVSGEVKGKPEAIQYSADLGVENFSAKGPHLKSKPVINGTVRIQTDRIEKFLFELKAPGNELTLSGSLQSFLSPKISFALTSKKGMDFDQWIEFPAPAAGGAGASPGKPSTGEVPGAATGTASSDLDAMLEPLRANEILKRTSVEGIAALSFVKAKNVRIEGLQAKLTFKNLESSLNGIQMKVFGGSVAGSFACDLKPKAPTYAMNFTVSGLDLGAAVETQFQSMKNTVTGKLSASMKGDGASFNPGPAKKNLSLKGDFKLVNGAFETMDIAKIADQAINGSLEKVADKVPLLKGRGLKVKSSGGSKYELMSGTFTIKNGVLEAPDFNAKAAPKGGIDLKGMTKMGLIDEALEAKWELTDTQRITGADQLSVEVAGRTIRNYLAKSEKDPVTLPISVGCKWSAPCVNTTAIPEYLAGIAAHRLMGEATQGVKQKVQEKVQDAVKNAVKNGVGNALKGLFGK